MFNSCSILHHNQYTYYKRLLISRFVLTSFFLNDRSRVTSRKQAVFLLLVLFSIPFHSKGGTIKALENEKLMLPFLWATDVTDPVEYQEIVGGYILHPLTIGRSAFTFLYSGVEQKNSQFIKKGLDVLKAIEKYPHKKETENSTLYLYPDDYEDFEAQKWWSGMANSAIAISYLLAYEIKGKEIYKERAVRAMNGVILPVAEGGSALDLGENRSWYLEYVDAEITEEDAYFVHNGYLFSLAALIYFDKVLGGDEYQNAFDKGLAGLESKEREFYYADLKWTYYMLNPRSIESLHYSIFELILLEALLSEKKLDWLEQSLRVRRKMIANEYSLHKRDDGQVVFNLTSGPHFYWQDLYPTKVLAYAKGEMIEINKIPRDYEIKPAERLFLNFGKHSSVLDSVSIYQEFSNRSFKLFTLEPKHVSTIRQGYINSTVDASHQAILLNDSTIEAPSSNDVNRATVVYKFPETIDLYNSAVIGFTFKSDVEIISMKLDITNSYLETSGRYYLPQPKDTLNLVVLRGFSFKDYNLFTSKRIKTFQVSYYYKAYKGYNKKIQFSKIFLSDNPTLIGDILSGKYGEVNFEEKISEGNIY
jgi:hypothetical protein